MIRNCWLWIGLAFVPSLATAHNTNVTHPIVSLEAIRAIRQHDAGGFYRDLYRRENITNYGSMEIYWGTWNTEIWGSRRLYDRFDVAEDDADNGNYEKLFDLNQFNVIRGVVQEDDPFWKVLDHFYHAYTSERLSPNVPTAKNSRERALPWFVRSVNEFDYEAKLDFRAQEWFTLTATPGDDAPFAKELAFQTYGEALHHVEDMSSIAHVQNDSHLTKEFLQGQENDDYEGIFLPHRIFQFHNAEPNNSADQTNWFTRRSPLPPKIDSINQIWPPAASEMDWSSDSLARRVYNASVFKGELRPATLGQVISMWWNNEERTASGELADMFNADGKKYLYYDSRHFFEFPVWHIVGVGDYHFLWLDYASHSWANAWWPSDTFRGPSGHYYIEQKIDGEWRPDESNLAVAPGGMRRDLFVEYGDGNRLDKDKGTILLSRFADALIPEAVRYAAGFSRWWFDIANPPPYLKWVKVRQKAISVQQPDGRSDEYEFTGYDARWLNGHAFLEDDRQSETRVPSQPAGTNAVFVAERKLKRERPTQPLYRDRDLQVLLQFNEPMKSFIDGKGNYDPTSEFKLGLQLESSYGSGANADVMLPVEDRTKVSIVGIENMGSDDAGSACNKDHLKGSCWQVTIKGEVLKDIDELQGAVRLIVFAKDANNHEPDTSGTDDPRRGPYLDGKPQTPAKRKATWSGGTLTYKWYDGSTALSPEYFGSHLADGTRLAPSHFNYEYDKGDRSHILWFSHKTDPVAQTAATRNQGFDMVTITSMPKRDEENTLPDASPAAPP